MVQFPDTNKQKQNIESVLGENAKLLEEFLARVNWKMIGQYYWIFFVQFLASLFLIIAVVRLAMLVP